MRRLIEILDPRSCYAVRMDDLRFPSRGAPRVPGWRPRRANATKVRCKPHIVSRFDVRVAGVGGQVTQSLFEMGCYSVSLGDTIGAGTAGSTAALLAAMRAAGVSMKDLAVHFHDTYGQALANILIALDEVWKAACRL